MNASIWVVVNAVIEARLSIPEPLGIGDALTKYKDRRARKALVNMMSILGAGQKFRDIKLD